MNGLAREDVVDRFGIPDDYGAVDQDVGNACGRQPAILRSGAAPVCAVRHSKAQINPARCRVHSDAEALMLALWRAIKIV